MREAELRGGPGRDLAGRSLAAHLARLFSSEPGRRLLYEDATGWHTAGEMEEASRLTAELFTGAGLEAGDRLVLSAGSSLPFVIAHLAALRLGLVLVVANTSYTARELAHIAADCDPAGVVSDDPARAELLAAGTSRRLVRFSIAEGRVLGPAARAPAVLDRPEGGEPALIVYTSGTTGEPKGALLSQRSLLANALAVNAAWRFQPEDRLVLSLPLFHVHGLCVGLQASFAAGSSVILRPGFDPADVGRSIAGHSATLFFGVPTMYARLVGIDELSRLRLATSGSAPLPAGLHEEISHRHGQSILERYGTSETLMIATNPYEGERRPGSVGRPFPGVALRLGDLGDDGTGEVLVKSPSLFSGYFGRAGETRAAFDDEGWFRTGDLGRLDADGYLHLVGRRSDLIITGGYNVYPPEVEEVLRRHPAVHDAAVVGEPDELWGERVVAYVEAARAGLKTACLLDDAATQLAPYKLPRRIEVVDSLPRNALGKVVKSLLGRSPG